MKRTKKRVGIEACDRLDALYNFAVLGSGEAKQILTDIRDGLQKMCQELGV